MATRRCTRSSYTALAAGAAAVLVLLSSCSSGGGSDDAGGSGDSAASLAAPRPENAAENAAGADAQSARDAAQPEAGQPEAGQPAPGQPVAQQSVISTGSVALRTDDVAKAIFDVRGVVATHRGTIAEDETQTDRSGVALRSRMVLRIPTAQFGDAMAELERVATLVSSDRQTADVTTQVLDTDVRVAAQKRSIARIQALYDQATTIGDVVNLEGELARRQADLASLEAQQRYLADQTSLSTITLSVERNREQTTPADPDTHDAGFLAGLSGGWKAMQGFLVGLATVAGALLPWLVLALILGVPTWLALRRLRRRPESGPETA
ncbi:MAG TPA: DUF4349 domain-containing protein [Nocardioides bacterium]|uniref:DUF4349 domain-containing protein n=1 Tax=uncultured Nocardioides sp. TaxID=198441 RepID=UPI000EE47101|nr:DUF4349 domain-containing protein [uncultured Nocardioides sp.]HCB07390.1 DUF4349 domain-containing protein [Nocardioides sp.]